MSEHYTIISADAHAGLPADEYRPYLDAAHHRQFDDYLAERHAIRDQALTMNYDYIMGWETENAEGLRGAWDIEQRDKELDADGVTAEVMFADADAITGMASPPFGAGLSAGAIADPELAFAGARAHNRFLAEMCSRSPVRHGGIALVPITHGVDRSVAENLRVGKAVVADWDKNPTLVSISPAFGDNAPLWYYVLAEAQYEWVLRAKAKGGKGDEEPLRLGTVGGRIVAETLIGLLWADGHSYLRQAPNWKPDEIRSMGDLITAALS